MRHTKKNQENLILHISFIGFIMYFIPQDLLRKFQVISGNNCSSNGRHIETLAYMLGHEADGNLIGTHLIFPEHNGTSSRVDDRGND